MSPEVAEALEASIRHWDENAKAKSLDAISVLGQDCALCKMFFEKGLCSGCPVYVRTSRKACRGTPFIPAMEAYHDCLDGDGRATLEDFRVSAIAERDFLISLREPVES